MTEITVTNYFEFQLARAKRADVIIVKGPLVKWVKTSYPDSREKAVKEMEKRSVMLMLTPDPCMGCDYYISASDRDSVTLTRV